MTREIASTKSPRIVERKAQWLPQIRYTLVALSIGLALIVSACAQPASRSTTTPTGTTVCRSWQLIPSPNPSSSSGQPLQNMLFAVSASSPTDAWTAGVSMEDDRSSQDLVEHWNGATWSVVASPGAGALWGVTAVSPTDAWAVGGTLQGSIFDLAPAHTQILHWNGTQWSITPSPDAGARSNNLQGVAALAANDVWAVGSFSDADSIERQLIERWDGATWRITPSPSPSGALQTRLTGIAHIPGASQLWAVGSSSTTRDPTPMETQPLIERWDGSTWRLVPGPTLPHGALGGVLRGVIALSPTEAWAVGEYAAASDQPPRPLIAHWNGSVWQVSASANGSTSFNGSLASVAAFAPGDAHAVGNSLSAEFAGSLLIEQWNGTAWQTAMPPNPISGTPGESILYAAAADTGGNYWAVGSSRKFAGPEGVFQTLVERYCP